MGKDYFLSLLIEAKGNVEQKIDSMNKALGTLESNTSKTTQIMASTFGNMFSNMASSTVGFLKGSASEYMDFEHNLVVSAAKFGGIEKGDAMYKELEKTIQDIGATSEFSTAQASEAMNNLATSGFSAQQSIEMLPQLVDLATASNMSLSEAADIASKSLGAFNMISDDPLVLAQNFEHLADSMTKTVNTGILDMPTYFETIKNGAGAFTAMGQSLEDFNALTIAMSKFGKTGADAGTALKIVALQLSTLPKPAREAMDSIGVSSFDATGKMRPIIDILDDIQKKTVDMADDQKQSIYKDIFGSEAIAAMAPLMTQGLDDVYKYQQDLNEAAGITAEVAAKNRESFKNQNELFKSSISGFNNAIWSQLQAPMTAAMQEGSLFFSNMTLMIEDPKAGMAALTQQFQNLATEMGAFAVNVLSTFTQGMASLGAQLYKSFSEMSFFGAMLTSLAIGIIAITVAYKTFTFAVMFAKKVQMMFNGVMLIFNTIMSLNPIFFIIGGIMALGAAMVWAYGKVEWFANIVNFLWGLITGITDAIFGLGSAILGVFGIGKKKDKKSKNSKDSEVETVPIPATISNNTITPQISQIPQMSMQTAQIPQMTQQFQNIQPNIPNLQTAQIQQIIPVSINPTAVSTNTSTQTPVVNVNSNYDELIALTRESNALQKQALQKQQPAPSNVQTNQMGGKQ